MCPSRIQKWGTKVEHIYCIKVGYIKICTKVGYKSGTHALKVGYIYYIKWGTTKHVPQWCTKVGHIYYIKMVYIKMYPCGVQKWGTGSESWSNLLYKVGTIKYVHQWGTKVGYTSGAHLLYKNGVH